MWEEVGDAFVELHDAFGVQGIITYNSAKTSKLECSGYKA
jgi:hypothetical protein